MIDNYKLEFYKYLNGDISVADIESYIFKQTTDLEQRLDTETFFNLINLNFKDQNIKTCLKAFILEQIVQEGEFETWKLKKLLNDFLTDNKKIHKYLDQLYHLYCGIYQENGKRKYEFKFLANLGLNYFYWVDEGYLKTNYGANWKKEYEKCFADFEFYHQQLKPFAEEILKALNENKIQIFNNGTYLITDSLKDKFETNKIYALKHPTPRP
jgi:hypothetical protein